MIVEKRLVDINGFMKYTGLGRNNAMKLGREIGATIRIGRKVLYDLKKADTYFDNAHEL